MAVLTNTTRLYRETRTQSAPVRSEQYQRAGLVLLALAMLAAILILVNQNLQSVPASETERIYRNFGLSTKKIWYRDSSIK